MVLKLFLMSLFCAMKKILVNLLAVIFGSMLMGMSLVNAADVAVTHEVPSIVIEASSTSNDCVQIPQTVPANVDLQRVREAWLGWYNQARAKNGLAPYVYNDQLNRTATVWSVHAENKGTIDHKRAGQKVFYDYKKVIAWFADLGLKFKNVKGKTATENIAWDYYKCPTVKGNSGAAADCTDNFIKAIRHGFDFFMSEKNKKYRPHYESIMNPQYKEIGLGIAVDPVHKKFFLTVHYATEITSKPKAVCS